MGREERATSGHRAKDGGPVIPGPRGHGGAYAPNMSIDPGRELITAYMVQSVGAGKDGARMHAAFPRAAVAAFGKK